MNRGEFEVDENTHIKYESNIQLPQPNNLGQ